MNRTPARSSETRQIRRASWIGEPWLRALPGATKGTRGTTGEHISPGLLRILDRLDDTPAEIVTELGETLRQTPLGVALTGDMTR
ncbi:hypothetical protein ACH4KO_33945 [Streptomyces anulatus]